MGLIGQAVPFLLFAWGQREVSSGLAGVYTGATPLLTVPVVWLFLHKRPSAGEAAASVIGFVGLTLVFAPWQAGSGSLRGQLLCLAGALCYALAYAYAAHLLSRVTEDKLSLAAAQAMSGALFMLPLVGMGSEGGSSLTGVVLGAMALLGLGTAVAFACNYWLIARIGPVQSSIAFYMIPVVAVVGGLVGRHERLVGHEITGCLVVVGALGILYAWNRRRAPASTRAAVPAPEPAAR
jgi:drug/metabolite transporter (DMT)-like permease